MHTSFQNSFKISYDAEKINAIINHPDVKKHVQIAGSNDNYLDTTPLFTNGAIAFLTPNEDGGILVIPDKDGGAEGHIFAKKPARGGDMARTFIDAKAYIFENKMFDRLYGYVSKNNIRALKFTKKIGGIPIKKMKIDRGMGVPEDVIMYEF